MHRCLGVLGLVSVIGLVSACGGSSPEAGSPEGAENRAAVDAATSWLVLLDEGNYGESWSRSATVFRTGNGSPEGWASAASEMRGPLGRMISRRLKQAAPAKVQEGASYAYGFETNFEGKPNAIEEVTVVLDGGFWKVAGYLIR